MSDLKQIRDLALSDFYIFAKGVVGFSWLDPEVHLPLCRKLQKNPTRMLVVLPRGWLKTSICSIAYPLWRAAQNPNFRTLIVQNTYTNAVAKLRVIRGIIEKNPLFRALFPEVLPTKDCTWKDDCLTLNRSRSLDAGTFEAAGTRTTVISRHYDLIIEDDTTAPELDDLNEMGVCPLKEDIVQAIGWHRLVPPLLVSPLESQNFVVGTRWFLQDLISWVKENEKFTIHERSCLETDGVSDEKGKVTYEGRFSKPVLDDLRTRLGPYLFSCLYLNTPVTPSEMIFQPDWYKFYDTEPTNLFCFTTVDPSGDPEFTKGDPDFNVVITTGQHLKTGQIYVLEYFRGKCSPSELIDKVFQHVERWHPVKVGVETVQYQATLQYWLRERMQKEGKYFIVEALSHGRKSKGARILGLQPLVANGALLFRRTMSALLNEFSIFPYGKNDDMIDALSMQLPLWRVTSAVHERQEKESLDPFTLDSVLMEVSGRNKVSNPFEQCLQSRLAGMLN